MAKYRIIEQGGRFIIQVRCLRIWWRLTDHVVESHARSRLDNMEVQNNRAIAVIHEREF